MPNGYVLNNAQYVCVFFYSVNMQKKWLSGGPEIVNNLWKKKENTT